MSAKCRSEQQRAQRRERRENGDCTRCGEHIGEPPVAAHCDDCKTADVDYNRTAAARRNPEAPPPLTFEEFERVERRRGRA
jgi:hypothetical protein